MKKEYDFTKAKRGPVVPVPRGKTRITIRRDGDVLESPPGRIGSCRRTARAPRPVLPAVFPLLP